MIFPIKQKQEPEIGTIRVINRYAFLPTKVEISNGVWGWIWLDKYEEKQEYTYSDCFDESFDGVVKCWKTIAKTLKTK